MINIVFIPLCLHLPWNILSKCLVNDLKYLHLGPYFDNPNFDAMKQKYYNTYYYDSVEFLSHLKGGFSESKLSDVQNNNTSHFLKAINDRI